MHAAWLFSAGFALEEGAQQPGAEVTGCRAVVGNVPLPPTGATLTADETAGCAGQETMLEVDASGSGLLPGTEEVCLPRSPEAETIGLQKNAFPSPSSALGLVAVTCNTFLQMLLGLVL